MQVGGELNKKVIAIPIIALGLLVAGMTFTTTLQIQQAQAAFESQSKDFGQGREDGVAAGASGY